VSKSPDELIDVLRTAAAGGAWWSSHVTRNDAVALLEYIQNLQRENTRLTYQVLNRSSFAGEPLPSSSYSENIKYSASLLRAEVETLKQLNEGLNADLVRYRKLNEALAVLSNSQTKLVHDLRVDLSAAKTAAEKLREDNASLLYELTRANNLVKAHEESLNRQAQTINELRVDLATAKNENKKLNTLYINVTAAQTQLRDLAYLDPIRKLEQFRDLKKGLQSLFNVPDHIDLLSTIKAEVENWHPAGSCKTSWTVAERGELKSYRKLFEQLGDLFGLAPGTEIIPAVRKLLDQHSARANKYRDALKNIQSKSIIISGLSTYIDEVLS
jgi:DNA repair exonuclease SbcCD ATPase subunit